MSSLPSFPASLPLHNRPIWRRDVARAYQEGASLQDLRAFYAVSKERIARILAREGLLPAPRPRQTPAHPRQDLVPDEVSQAYRNGESLRALSQSHGCDPQTIKTLLQQLGVELRTHAQSMQMRKHQTKKRMQAFSQQDPLPKRLAQSYRMGAFIRDLAYQNRMSRSTIRSILLSQGVQLRTIEQTRQLRQRRERSRPKKTNILLEAACRGE